MKYALARLAPYWGELLTVFQRDGWNLYGENVVMTNALGQPFHLTGQNHFLRANIPRIQSGISVLETAPTVFNLGTFTAPTIDSALTIGQTIKIAFDNTDDWANHVGGYMICYGGQPTGPGQGFYGGPWRFMGTIAGNPAPPASPQNLPSHWTLSVDNVVWAQIRVIQPDGRFSLPIVLGPETVVLI